jgi:phosphate-selective porin
MSSSRSLVAVLGLALAATGCATGSAWLPAPSGPKAAETPPEGLQERVERMEVELAELREERREGAAEAAAPATPAAPAPEKKKEALTFYVTPDITFKPGLRLQTRYQYDTRTNNNELFIARFRLKAGGQAYEIATYYLEMKIDNTGRTNANPSAAVENGWLDFTYNPDLIGRAGLYDVPFSRDALTSDSKLLLVDRSLIKDALTSVGFADNGIGVMTRGRPFGGRFEYAVGGFNNDRYSALQGSSSRNTAWLMPMGRVAVDLLDPAPLGGYADYRGSYVGKGQRLTIGANGAWLGDARDTVSGFQQKYDIFAWGADLFFNKGPYTLQAEYGWFRLTGNVDRSNYGWYAQGGYLLEALNQRLDAVAPWFPEMELAARYQDLDAKTFRRQRERQTSVGANFYIRDHNLKIQTDYNFRNIEDTEDRGLYQLQLQIDF